MKVFILWCRDTWTSDNNTNTLVDIFQTMDSALLAKAFYEENKDSSDEYSIQTKEVKE